MKSKNILIGFAAAAMMLATSCATSKQITYMQGFENGDTQAVRIEHRMTAQPDDKIAIYVSSKDPELAQKFNLLYISNRLGYTNNTSQATNIYAVPYTVAPDGTINFPLLGDLHVAGLTRQEISTMVEKELQNRGLLKDAIVNTEFTNAKVAVLGDVKAPGEYAIDRDNMTILQALSKAQDLNITGLRKNVLVVREEGGKDVAYRVDLTDTQQMMQSPAYYIQQNDVIYVEPNNMKKRSSDVNGNNLLTPSFWLSVVSVLTSVSLLIFR